MILGPKNSRIMHIFQKKSPDTQTTAKNPDLVRNPQLWQHWLFTSGFQVCFKKTAQYQSGNSHNYPNVQYCCIYPKKERIIYLFSRFACKSAILRSSSCAQKSPMTFFCFSTHFSI